MNHDPSQAAVTVDAPALPQADTATGSSPTEAAVSIGPYRLLQLLGKGGMGEVWMAEQAQPVQRRVALKIIKADLNGPQVLARFEAERQALALMDHPNIAKVLDAGATPEGTPYFVMELVKGISFTQYCDREKLSLRERLELFILVCSAVQHAHLKGIIYRDLKPSNVLVGIYDGKPIPKVIDFGVAKATNQKLTDHTMFTAVGQIVGTLEYMAPEQAELNNLDIDTRADVYSLGVMLYELLTGAPPFSAKQLRGEAILEILRLIREVEPPRPSTKLSGLAELPDLAAKRKTEPHSLSRLLRGDLDWIVMKCLEKERSRRYETANQLGEELRRFLADEPVLAGPPSLRYRARKFLQRNRGGVIAASLILLALIACVVGTSIGLVMAEYARRDAENLAVAMSKLAASEKSARRLVEVREREALWHLYKARMFPLMQAGRERSFARVSELLAETTPKAGEPDFRGWEWYYYQDLVRQVSNPLLGSAPYLALGDWCARTGQVAALTVDHTIDIWDADLKKIERTLPKQRNRSVNSMSWSPNGDRLACVCSNSWAVIWDAGSGKLLHEFQTSNKTMYGLSWAPDGERLAVGDGTGEVFIVNARTGEILNSFRQAAKQDVPISVAALDWNPDGERLAIGYRFGYIGVYNTRTKEQFRATGSSDGTLANVVRWNPDGKRFVAAHGPRTLVYDEKCQVRFEPRVNGAENRIGCARWSPDGNNLLTGGADQSIRLWQGIVAKDVVRLHAGAVGTVAWSPDGRKFLSMSSASGLLVSSVSNKGAPAIRVVAPDVIDVWDLAWSPDNRWLAVAGIRRTIIVDALAGGTVRELPNFAGRDQANSRVSVWHPATHELITLHYGFPDFPGKVAFWNAETAEFKREWTISNVPAGGNASLDISRDGRWLAVGNFLSAGTPFLWDVAEQKAVPAPASAGRTDCLAFSPDGRILATAGRDGLFLWEVPSLRLLAQRNNYKGQLSLSWKRDGSALIGAMSDGSFHLYRVSDGERLSITRGHKGSIVRIAFSPDGHRIATSSVDGSVAIWDAETCDQLISIPIPAIYSSTGLRAMAWSPDSRRLACGFDHGPIYILGTPAIQATPKTIDHLPARK